jgi:LPXTG-motif cell wall-anchored protein
VLTRLNGIDGVESSSALLADDGSRMVQITIRRGAKVTKVVAEVQKALRAEVPDKTPVPLESKSVKASGLNQDWLTVGQLNTLAAMKEISSPESDNGYWLLGLAGVLALGAFFFWFLRRKRTARQRSKAHLGSPVLPIASSM